MNLRHPARIHQLKFYYPYDSPQSQIKKPTKFLLGIDPNQVGDTARQAGVVYSVPDPSFRVRLDCQK